MNTLSSPARKNKTSITISVEQFQREQQKVVKHLQRAMLVGTPATLTVEEWLTILEHYHWTCVYCKEAPYHSLEHRIPLKLGGGTTFDNCVPACNRCNAKKGNKIALLDRSANLFTKINIQTIIIELEEDSLWISEEEVLRRIFLLSTLEGTMGKEAIKWLVRCEVLIERHGLFRFMEKE